MAEVARLDAILSADTKGYTAAMQVATKETDKFAASAAKTDLSLNKTKTNFTGLNRVIQDLPFGFIAIQNNLEQIFPAAGALGLAFSAVVSAITFAQVGTTFWTRGLKDNAQQLKTNTISTDEYAEAIKKAYTETSKEYDQVAKLIAQSQLAITTRGQQKTILKDLQGISQEYFGDLKIENGLIVGLNEAYEKYADNILKVAKAKAAAETIGKLTDSLLKAKQSVVDIDNQFTNLTLTFDKAGKLLSGASGENAFDKLKNSSQAVADILAKGLPTFEDIAKLSAITGKSEAEINHILSERQKYKTTDAQLTAQIASASALIAASDVGSLNTLKEKVKTIKEELTPAIRKLSFDKFEKDIGVNTYSLGTQIQSALDKAPAIPLNVKVDVKPAVTDAEKSAQKLIEAIKQIEEDVVAGIGEGIGNLISGKKNPFGSLFQVLGEGIKALGKQLIVLGALGETVQKALAALITNPVLAVAAGIALEALGTIVANKGVQLHAEGGIFTQPTQWANHIIGEKGPEALVPLNRMNELGLAGGGRQVVVMDTRISGNDLILIQNRAQTAANRAYGSNYNRRN